MCLPTAELGLWVDEESSHERVPQAMVLVADCERELGADEPTTISARDHLASLLAMAGEYDGALTIGRHAATDAARVFGDDAPSTRHVRTNLAATLFSMGRPGEAVKELDAVLAGSTAALDPESALQDVRARRLLALSHRELGQSEEARTLLERLVPDAVQLLGSDAPLTRDLAGLLGDLRSYRGPRVTARGDFPRPWVFVADARASLAGRFAAPPARVRRPALSADVAPGAMPVDRGDDVEQVAVGEDSDVVGVISDGIEERAHAEEGHPSEVRERGSSDAARVEVRVLGPLEVLGWRDPGGRATQLAEILTYLVFHRDRPVRGPALRLALRPEIDDEITEETLHAYVSMLRRALGRDLFPPATREGYRLAGTVRSDWERFCVLAGSDASPENLEEALDLVRGRPFAGVPEGTFRWVDAELVVSEIDTAVANAALRLAEVKRSMGDTERASWAVRQGLSCSPYNISLWRFHLSLAEGRGPGALARARKEAEAALGADASRT